jgi:5'-deoxynucleotidase YfbR-like HD superfamily hydrolase
MQSDILTVSGNFFNFLTPEKSFFNIEDIATGLSNTCRFAGQCEEFYSVAQHSYIVSQLVPKEFALHGLLHDAAEAFIHDITSPLKKLLSDYKIVEKRVETAIFDQFGLPHAMPPEVKYADLVALATEERDLMPGYLDGRVKWGMLENISPAQEHIIPLPPKEAKRIFLNRFYQLILHQES